MRGREAHQGVRRADGVIEGDIGLHQWAEIRRRVWIVRCAVILVSFCHLFLFGRPQKPRTTAYY